MIQKIRTLIKRFNGDYFHEETNSVYWIRLNGEEAQLLEDLIYEYIKDNNSFRNDARYDWVHDLLDKFNRMGTES